MATHTKFEVAGTHFQAIRVLKPRPHWLVHTTETSQTFQAGAGGIKNTSVPAMKKSIEDILVIAYKGDITRLRKGFELPATLPVSFELVQGHPDFNDYDLIGPPLMKRLTVPIHVERGDTINLYLVDGMKHGVTWLGNIPDTLTAFAAESRQYHRLIVESLTKAA